MLSLWFHFVFGLFALVNAQSSTSSTSSSTTHGSSSISSPSATATNGTTIFPTTGTTTLFSNGTATATIINGTDVNQTATAASTSSTVFPTLGNVSPCVANCLQTSVSVTNCSSITEVDCYCSNTGFRITILDCISTQCPNELQGAETLAQQFCELASVTLTFPPETISGSATVSPTSISPSPIPTTSTGNGGFSLPHPLMYAVLTGVGSFVWLLMGS